MSIAKWLLAKKLGGGSPFPPVIKRKTGNPIELTDAASAPMVKCVTAITGSQDLHGYDRPWVGGAGKNKLPLLLSKIKTFNTAGTWTGNTYVLNGIAYVFQSYDNETITGVNISSNGATGRSVIYYYRDDNASIVQSQTVTFSGIGGFNRCAYQDGTTWHESTQAYFTATITDGIAQIWCELLEGWSGSFTSAPQVEIGSSPTTFAPYSNICPITAYTEGEIEVRGKNIFDSSVNLLVTGNYIVYDTGERKSGNQDYKSTNINNRVRLINVSKYIGRTLYSNFTVGGSKPGQAFYDENLNYISGKKQFPVVVPEGAYYLGITTNAEQTDVMISVFPIEDYEPYTSTTHATTYPSAIYQGSEDCVNGEVTEEWRKVIFDGSNDEVWELQSINSYGIANFQISLSSLATHRLTFISNYLPCQDTLISVTTTEGFFTNDRLLFLRLNSTRASTVEELRTWLSNNNFELAYEPSTPTTSSVTPTNLPIKSLSGYNHIESSTGEMTIDYITDAYQNFVNTVESALPNTRKGGVKAMDIFLSLEKKDDDKAEVEKSEEKR